MITLQRTTTAALILALLAACSDSPRHVPPVAKTNPEPRERYEITVELIDPPPGIQSISGSAHFSVPDVICMRSPDPIAGYTPGSHYEHPFELEPIGDNTYRGHIYLDWPIDEDYYGLGVCRWKLYKATVYLTSSDYTHDIDLRGSTDFPVGTRKWLCRRSEPLPHSPIGCISPANEEIEAKFRRASYEIVISTEES